MPVDRMDGEELLGYFLIHCETERALFHKLHYVRLRELAGEPVAAPDELIDFFTVRPPETKDLVKKARARMSEPPPPPPPTGWDDDPLSCP